MADTGERSTATWPVVLGEGIAMAAIGALIALLPGLGASGILLLSSIALLLNAIISTWRLRRDVVAPLHIAAVAFRAGVGLTVSLVVIGGSLIAEDIDAAIETLAVVLGIGYVLYGVSVFLAPLVQREPDSRLPLGASALGGGIIVIGTLLVIRATAGIEALSDTASLLGILMLATGMALTGWALVLKPQEESHGA